MRSGYCKLQLNPDYMPDLTLAHNKWRKPFEEARPYQKAWVGRQDTFLTVIIL